MYPGCKVDFISQKFIIEQLNKEYNIIIFIYTYAFLKSNDVSFKHCSLINPRPCQTTKIFTRGSGLLTRHNILTLVFIAQKAGVKTFLNIYELFEINQNKSIFVVKGGGGSN